MANVKPTYMNNGGLPQPVDTATDSVAANAVYVQNSTTPDTSVGISRDVSNNLVLTDPVTGSKTLADLTGPNDWTEAVNTAAPNNAVPATSWTPSNAAVDVDAIVRPKGVGALLAQVPDAAGTGGDKRGIYATDFQRVRTSADQVASGSYSVVLGGLNNRAAGEASVVAGSNNTNTVGDGAVIAGGANHQVLANYGTIGGGASHITSGPHCTVAGGNINVAAGAVGAATVGGGAGNFAFADYATVAGGIQNIVTGAGAAVGGGQNSVVTGEYAAVPGGQSLYASALGEAALGQFNVDLLGTSNAFVATDPILTVGNGTGAGSESNALTLLKNGALGVNLGAAKPTEKLDVAGNVKFSGALMPNNLPGTAGQFLTSAGAGLPPTWAAGGGGLTNWTEAVSTAAPNATVPVTSFTATNAATNVDGALVAKGTGSTLAQVPDSTATGGDKRGTYATDWQKSRTVAARVAAGDYSTVAGGYDNRAGSAYSAVLGGESNLASGASASIGGGRLNTAAGQYGFIGAGATNNAAAQYGAVVGGQANNAYGFHSVIGGGQSNVAGVNLVPGSSHNTVGGGQSNVASGQYSTVAGGTGNTAGGGTRATVSGGASNTASFIYSTVGGGGNNAANGLGATIPGGVYGSARGVAGRFSYSSGATVLGKQQMGILVTRGQTTTGASLTLTVDGGAISASPLNVNALPDTSAYAIRCTVVARDNAGTTAAWEIGGLVKRGAGAATTAVVGVPLVTSLGADAAAAAWTVALIADTTQGAAVVQVTDGTGTPTTVDWVATMYTTEIDL